MTELCVDRITSLPLSDFTVCPLWCSFSFWKRWKSDRAKTVLCGGWSNTEMRPVNLCMRDLTLSCWWNTSYMSQQSLWICAFNFCSVPIQRTELMVAPVGMNSKCTTLLMTQQNMQPWTSLWWYFTDCLLFSVRMMHPAFVSGDNVAHDVTTFMSTLQQLSANVHLASVSVPLWAFREPIVRTTFRSEISNYCLHLLMWNGNFLCYCLLRNVTILLDHFINTIWVSLISCCLWSPATLLVVQDVYALSLHHGYMQPNVEQHWYLHNRPHKQLSFAAVNH